MAHVLYNVLCGKKCSWITLFSLSQKYNYIQLGCYIKLMHTSTLGHREIFLLLSLWTEQAQLKSCDPRLNRPNVSTTCRTSQLVITAPTATTKYNYYKDDYHCLSSLLHSNSSAIVASPCISSLLILAESSTREWLSYKSGMESSSRAFILSLKRCG